MKSRLSDFSRAGLKVRIKSLGTYIIIARYRPVDYCRVFWRPRESFSPRFEAFCTRITWDLTRAIPNSCDLGWHRHTNSSWWLRHLSSSSFRTRCSVLRQAIHAPHRATPQTHLSHSYLYRNGPPALRSTKQASPLEETRVLMTNKNIVEFWHDSHPIPYRSRLFASHARSDAGGAGAYVCAS